jgi:GT2 family glycosyltransferase
MTTNLPKVSIIVLNYNGKKYLDNCFQSLAEVDYPNFEVVMVDNDSTDDSVEYVRKNYDWIRVIESGRNGGFAFGMNTGIKRTEGEYVFLLDNDTIITKNFLRRMVEVAESDPEIGVASPIPLPITYKDCADLILDKIRWNKVISLGTVAGATMLIKRKILEDVGLLDETCFMYWEDTEFCWRVILLGYKVVAVYDAIIYHIWSGISIDTGFTYSKKWMYEFLKNKIYVHLKVRNIFYLALFLPYEVIRSFARIIYYKWYHHLVVVCSVLFRHFVFRPSQPCNMFAPILKAWKWNISNLRETIEKRRKIMKRKKVSDWRLVKLMIIHDIYEKKEFDLFEKCKREYQLKGR